MENPTRPIDVLLVEDNPGDIRLAQEALKEGKLHVTLNVVRDGYAALDYLFQRGDYATAVQPDVILLDLNLPGLSGREVLSQIKHDEQLRVIPVVVLTSSDAEEDVYKSYHLHANCYVIKPIDFTKFVNIVRQIEQFWFSVVKLPADSKS